MRKVITYGTFDLFHQGHYNILKRAKEYGDYLIVGVTGDSYDISRGKLSVHDDIATRIENVKNTGLVDAIIIEEYLGQKISDVIKYDIDTFVIGDDWRGKFDHLGKYCDVVYLERTKNISSTQLREENFPAHHIGIITDQENDNTIVSESKLVSGFKISGVYADDEELRERFKDKYQLETAFDNEMELFEASDIVYVRTRIEDRYDYIKEALEMGKHVICDPPFTISAKKQRELFDLAKDRGVALIDNVKMVYVRVFNQIMWMCHGGLIGDILQFNCSVSKNDKNIKDFFDELMALALTPMVKIMGTDYTKMIPRLIREGDGVEFGSIVFEYPAAEAIVKVGNNVRVKNQMEIIGSKGTIRLKDNWWKSNYFEMEDTETGETKIYNMNFAGNGFKFLLKEMLVMFGNNKTESAGLFPEESVKISEILEEIHRR